MLVRRQFTDFRGSWYFERDAGGGRGWPLKDSMIPQLVPLVSFRFSLL